MPKAEFEEAEHRGARVILLRFSYDAVLQARVRSITDSRWSQTKRCWYVPFREGRMGELQGTLNEEGLSVAAPVHEGSSTPDVVVADHRIDAHVRQLQDHMNARRYSASTISTYTEALAVFLRFFGGKQVEELNERHLIEFNNKYILEKRLSASYQNQVVSAVKLFFSTVERRKLQPELIRRPKRAKTLPNVLSKEEVKMLLGSLNNVKHRLMLSVIYACGLRCGELLRLRSADIDENRKLLIVKQGKGRKDRIVPLSGKIVAMLKEYREYHKTENYIFEGQERGEMYDARSLQQVLKHAVQRAGISKPVTLHWLRHSYATHLLEAGTDLRYIQEILGHSSSRTTEIYTHVSNRFIQQITSPFDNL